MSCPFLERDRLAPCLYKTSHRLSRRLEEILLFSASSFSEKKILMNQINFLLMADRLRESFQGLARETMIAIEFHSFSAFPLFRGDERWLERALENLIGNALKYTPEEGQVEVGGSVDAEKEKVEMWVLDTGRGIFPEEIQPIFQPFHRGRKALNEPGMGLGLALVKQVVDPPGGKSGFAASRKREAFFPSGSPASRIFSMRKGVKTAA